MFSHSSLLKKRGKGIIAGSFVRWHNSVRRYSMFEAVEFPAGVTDLNAGLADVDADALTLVGEEETSVSCGLTTRDKVCISYR